MGLAKQARGEAEAYQRRAKVAEEMHIDAPATTETRTQILMQTITAITDVQKWTFHIWDVNWNLEMAVVEKLLKWSQWWQGQLQSAQASAREPVFR